MIIDTHAHTFDHRLDDVRADILKSLENDILTNFIEVGYDRKSSEKALQLAKDNEKVYSAIGTHPHDAAKLTEEDIEFYRKNASHKKVVAIGEIGLDYHYDGTDKPAQKKAFIIQLELAHEVGLPVIVHLRDAYGDMQEILNEHGKLITNGVVFHCYAGSSELARQLSKQFDAYFSFGGIITFDKTDKTSVITSIPTDRLLIETDCPYLTPVPHRGKPNRPEYVEFVAGKMAEILGKTKEDVENMTAENAKRLFSKMK